MAKMYEILQVDHCKQYPRKPQDSAIAGIVIAGPDESEVCATSDREPMKAYIRPRCRGLCPKC